MIKMAMMLLMLFSMAVSAQTYGHAAQPAKIAGAHVTQLTLPNVLVRDSFNREHSLPDLLGNHIAIVNFVFTSCATICSALNATMQMLEKELLNRLGKDVILVSISVDPARDTPDKLRVHADKLGADPNWYWLTGRPVNIDQILKAFGIPTSAPGDHPPVIFVGNARSGQWLRWIGLPAIEVILTGIDQLADQL